MFQISPGKSVFGYLADTAIFGIAAKQPGQNSTDLAFTLSAVAFDHHHLLRCCAGDQAVTNELL